MKEDKRFLDLTLLRFVPGAASRLAQPVYEGLIRSGKGEMNGCWISEIGPLNEMAVIRSFKSEADRAEDHLLFADNSHLLQCADALVSLKQERFLAGAGLPFNSTGELGEFYEFRRYTLIKGGLAPTLAGWRNAIPKRIELSPLALLMHSQDDADEECIVHLWPYRSLDERQKIRAQANREGIWPPKDTIKWIALADSRIFLPAPLSPLR